MIEQIQESATFRAGYVAIIGEPNVGKSTLMNALLEQKLSIVTPKPQTTRQRVLGILSGADFQLVFLDTPGIIEPAYALQEAMVRSAQEAIRDADLILLLVDASRPGKAAEARTLKLLKSLPSIPQPLYLAINKTDKVAKASLLPLIEEYSCAYSFREIFPISALRLDGTGALLQGLLRELPIHPPYYPLDIVSEQQQRFFVSEIIREKIFSRCHEEVPYSSTVEIAEFKEREEGKWFISADLYVEKESQKAILIGRNGSMLKEIGKLARQEIEQFLDHAVFLELHVRVRENWRKDERWLRRFGYTS
jgi:GTP-binding protein Era